MIMVGFFMNLTATHINYFHICHRKLWLFANGINMWHTLANAILLPLPAFYYTIEELKLLCQLKNAGVLSISFFIFIQTNYNDRYRRFLY